MDNLITSIKPFYYASKFCGLFPYKICKNSLKFTIFGVFYCLIFGIFSTSIYIYRHSYFKSKISLLEIGILLRLYSSVLLNVLVFSRSFFGKNNLKKLFENFIEVDKSLKLNFGIFLNYKFHFKFSVIIFGIFIFKFLFVIFLAFSLAGGFEYLILFLIIFAQIFTFLPICVFFLNSLMILIGIYVRIKKFNLSLKNFKFEISKFEILKFKEIKKLNFKIMEIIELFNKFFSLSIALFTGANLVSQIVILFVYYLLISQRENYLKDYAKVSFTWNLINNLINFPIIILCSLIKNEIEKSEDIVQEKLLKNFVGDEKKFKKKIKIFILQLKHSRVKFSCGLFEFDLRAIMMVRFFFTIFTTVDSRQK